MAQSICPCSPRRTRQIATVGVTAVSGNSWWEPPVAQSNNPEEFPVKFRYVAIAAAAIFVPFAAACGADSTSELDKGELVTELEDSGMDTATAGCAADALIDADFTKDEIDQLNAGDEGVDSAKVEAFTKAVTGCISLYTTTGN